MRQIPLAIGPEPARSFENFMAGPNAGAIAHLLALSAGAPPVYLWGPPGSGKTHLLQAVVEQARRQGETSAWFGAGVELPWEAGEQVRWLLVDDCERLDAAQQQAAFSLFVQAAGSGAVIVGAGAVPPVDLPVREDLRTRLGWGHVFGLEPLAEPEVRAALRREADRRGTFLSDDVMDYLLNRFARDLKHLMAQLDRLDAFSLETKRAITVPLLRQMMSEEGPA
jgi:DnaA family protein